jgi:hypothetical protein
MTLVDGASDGAAHIGGHYTKVLADANSVACLREREHRMNSAAYVRSLLPISQYIT